MTEVTLKVAGMSCGHCVSAVERALREVKGAQVESVVVGQARVQLAEGVPVGALIDAVADAGYEAEEA
ncbi:MAG: heavy-metal-associated domain-containing protein [Gemmatimonadaceae bacterium]|nr:heavy-metal-associated domain-containing protein [Gemmatimonadaceae bacterium]